MSLAILYLDDDDQMLRLFAATMPEITSGVVEHQIPKPWFRETMRDALERAAVAVRDRG